MTSLFAGITKQEEGFGKEDRDIPLEIQDQKLLQWLVSRGKVQGNWKDTALQIRAKIDGLVKDLPPQVTLPKSRELNYFDMDDLFNQLVTKANEPQDKSLFGGYTSKKLKAIADIKYYYEKYNVFIAEAAENLVQMVKYDMYALSSLHEMKKSMQNLQKQSQELQRKESDHKRNANEALKQFEKACQEIGIKGTNVKAEVIALQADLPALLGTAAELAQTSQFLDAINFYKNWLSFSWKLSPEKKEMGDADVSNLLGFQVIEYVAKNGNRLLADYKEASDPRYIRPAKDVTKDIVSTSAESSGISINWDDSFDVSSSSSPEPVVAIDVTPAVNWDTEAAPKLDWGSEQASINWEITVENEGEIKSAVPVTDAGIVKSGETVSSSTTDNSDLVLTVLEDLYHRREFIFALHELDSFFKQRISDFNAAAQDTGKLQIDQARLLKFPESIVKVNTKEGMTKAHASVSAVLNSITNDKVQKLLEMKNSQSFVDRVAQSITLKFDRKLSSEASAVECNRRGLECETKIKETYPKLQDSKDFAISTKAKVEAAMTKLFNGRIVRIMGEVTTL